jgi:hypothetical protein
MLLVFSQFPFTYVFAVATLSFPYLAYLLGLAFLPLFASTSMLLLTFLLLLVSYFFLSLTSLLFACIPASICISAVAGVLAVCLGGYLS